MENARDLIGTTTLVKLKDYDGLEFAGFPGEGPFFCKVVAVDQVGIWVENRNFVTVELADSKGRSIPKNKRKRRRHVVNLLIPWSNVKTAVHFADDDASGMAGEALGEREEETGRIGFVT